MASLYPVWAGPTVWPAAPAKGSRVAVSYGKQQSRGSVSGQINRSMQILIDKRDLARLLREWVHNWHPEDVHQSMKYHSTLRQSRRAQSIRLRSFSIIRCTRQPLYNVAETGYECYIKIVGSSASDHGRTLKLHIAAEYEHRRMLLSIFSNVLCIRLSHGNKYDSLVLSGFCAWVQLERYSGFIARKLYIIPFNCASSEW